MVLLEGAQGCSRTADGTRWRGDERRKQTALLYPLSGTKGKRCPGPAAWNMAMRCTAAVQVVPVWSRQMAPPCYLVSDRARAGKACFP